MFNELTSSLFVRGRSFQPNPMFVGKEMSMPQSGAPERRFTLVGSGPTQKH
jgi:hypothetical protein